MSDRKDANLMQSDGVFQCLHDRSTRGETLTNDEQAALCAWYKEQDNAESAEVAQQDEVPSLAVLRSQVDEAISQLRKTARQIEEVTAENDAIRQDIGLLQSRLKPLANVQPA